MFCYRIDSNPESLRRGSASNASSAYCKNPMLRASRTSGLMRCSASS